MIEHTYGATAFLALVGFMEESHPRLAGLLAGLRGMPVPSARANGIVYYYWDFHVQLIALLSQANMHGVVLASGLQGEHVYFIFLRCSSVTDATVLSSRSMNMVSS
jgi:hypothetical protein